MRIRGLTAGADRSIFDENGSCLRIIQRTGLIRVIRTIRERNPIMPSAHASDSRDQSSGPIRQAASQPRRIDSHTLLGGSHLLMIEHGGHSYYLRMTRNNKLILTK
jgi:hemin uptake protein HemP